MFYSVNSAHSDTSDPISQFVCFNKSAPINAWLYKIICLLCFLICFYEFFISVVPVIVCSYLLDGGTKNSLNSFEWFF